ncbi:MAG: AlpA family phage regulatory protein [Pseudomonadota bacterium]
MTANLNTSGLTEAPPAPISGADDPLLTFTEVCTRVRLSRDRITVGVREGWFPAPLKIGKRKNAWFTSDIHRWIAGRASGRAA